MGAVLTHGKMKLTTVSLVQLLLMVSSSSAERVVLLVVEGMTQALLNRVYTPAIDSLMRQREHREILQTFEPKFINKNKLKTIITPIR